jgi:hypothetical protein
MLGPTRALILLLFAAALPLLTSAFVLIEGGTDSITIDRLDDGRGYGKSRIMEKETHYFRVKRAEPDGFAVVAEVRAASYMTFPYQHLTSHGRNPRVCTPLIPHSATPKAADWAHARTPARSSSFSPARAATTLPSACADRG